MPRTIDDIPTGAGWPEAGNHICKCVRVEFTKSSVKKTDGLALTWQTQDGEFQFTDTLYITAKALPRLALVAKKFCDGARELELDDDDTAAANTLANFIYEKIEGLLAIVTITEYEETFIHESGDKIGQKETRKKKRVAFAGYETAPEPF